jgi:hypothetical protein
MPPTRSAPVTATTSGERLAEASVVNARLGPARDSSPPRRWTTASAVSKPSATRKTRTTPSHTIRVPNPPKASSARERPTWSDPVACHWSAAVAKAAAYRSTITVGATRFHRGHLQPPCRIWVPSFHAAMAPTNATAAASTIGAAPPVSSWVSHRAVPSPATVTVRPMARIASR